MIVFNPAVMMSEFDRGICVSATFGGTVDRARLASNKSEAVQAIDEIYQRTEGSKSHL
jgi:hypothetical protein